MIRIAITDTEASPQNYPKWILDAPVNVEVLLLSFDKQNLDELQTCNGLILSGGVDSHPKYYQNSRLDYPNFSVFNEQRDEFELAAFEQARALQMPILAICRGLQLVNIALGGTLIQDLEEIGKNNHRKTSQGDGLHAVVVEKDSLFYEITQFDSGMVNSAHHQGVDVLAEELKVSVWSLDGVVEALEYKDPKSKPYFLAVQWHPERFQHPEFQKPFSLDLRASFLDAAKKYNL